MKKVTVIVGAAATGKSRLAEVMVRGRFAQQIFAESITERTGYPKSMEVLVVDGVTHKNIKSTLAFVTDIKTTTRILNFEIILVLQDAFVGMERLLLNTFHDGFRKIELKNIDL